MNKESIKYKALKLILQTGQIRESTLKLFISAKVNARSTSSRIFSSLYEEALIEKKRYRIPKSSNNRTGFDDAVRLTSKGMDFVLAEEDSYFLESYKDFEKKFVTRQGEGIPLMTERIEKSLLDNDILAMVSACDIPVFIHEKPSLSYLRATLLCENAYRKKGYLDGISKEECQNFLDKGIYYSIYEILDFAAEISSSLTDTIVGTRARGVFISNTSCYSIYIPKRYENRLMKVNQKGENGLMSFLENLATFTKIFERNEEFDKYVIDSLGNKKVSVPFYGKPYGLILSDGAMLSYAVATGHAKGKKSPYNGYSQSVVKSSTLLTAPSIFYEKIYITPMNLNGFYSLYYLLHHSLDDWKKDGISIMENDDRFRLDNALAETFPYVGPKDLPVTFMPVVEAKALYEFAHTEQKYIFVSFKDHLDVIARSVRKEAMYYDADEGEFTDDVMLYDRFGQPKGQSILDEYLKEKGKTFDKNTEGYDLPRRLGKSYIEFYNAIARGEILPKDIESNVKTKEFEPQDRHYNKTVILSCSMTKNLSNKVKEKAKEEGISVSRIVAKALKAYIEKYE